MNSERKQLTVLQHFISGGIAGIIECVTCHPLDTIKVRMQLSRVKVDPVQAAKQIISEKGFFGLYRGLGAVIIGISPKMAVRFSTFEFSKSKIGNRLNDTQKNFAAGLIAGVVETLTVVNATEVLKIRLQSDASLKHVGHAFTKVIQEEGWKALYKGISLTTTRQALNQAVNFTVYNDIKCRLLKYKQDRDAEPKLKSYEHLLIGAFSGALSPISNAPIDTIKTRVQAKKNNSTIVMIFKEIWYKEGIFAFYKGLIPRLLRIVPGQAVTFATYEKVSSLF